MYHLALFSLSLRLVEAVEPYDDERRALTRYDMLAMEARQRVSQGIAHKYHIHFAESAPSLHAQDTSFYAMINDSYTLTWRDGGGTLNAQDFGSNANGWYIKKECLRMAQAQGQCSELAWTCPHRAGENISGFKNR